MTERTTVRLDENLLATARAFAKKSGRTLTSLIEEGIQRVLHAQSEPAPMKSVFKTFAGSGYAPGIDPERLPSDLLKDLDEEEDRAKLSLPPR
jgi:hypothetical protein